MASLQELPLELHCEIWSYLSYPEHLAQTCKTLYAISQNPLIRTSFFLGNGAKYAIFAAIRRPHIFTEELFNQLLARGAILPRSLVHELRARFGVPCGEHRAVTYWCWGMRTEPRAALAVLKAGHEMYDVSEFHTTDNELYLRWINARSPMDSQPIKELFEKHNFVLLPFGSGVYSTHFGFRHSGICDTNLSATAARAIKKDPTMAEIILDSDSDLLPTEKTAIITDLFSRAGKLGSIQLLKNLKALVGNAKLGFEVSKEMARQVVLGLKHIDHDTGQVDADSRPFSESAAAAWNALRGIDDLGLLTFSLSSLIEEVASIVAGEPTSAEMRNLQKQLCERCPYVKVLFAKGRWLQLFIDHQAAKSAADTANSPSLSSASTSALLATPESSKCNTAKLRWKKALKAVDTLVAAQRALCDATVTTDEVIRLMMRAEITNDTLPLTYAATYLDVSDWRAVAVKLIRLLLCQVWRGPTLVAVSAWFSGSGKANFRALLAEEISKHAIATEAAMPSLAWQVYNRAGAHWPSRTSWVMWEEHGPWYTVLGNTYSYSRITLLKHPEQLPDDADPKVEYEVMHATPAEKQSLRSFLEGTVPVRPRVTHPPDEPALCTIDKHNALAIVELCGSKSPAARIVMKHAVLDRTKRITSYVKSELVLALQKHGCDFTVWHLWAFQKQGSSVPDDVFEQLKFVHLTDEEGILPMLASRGKHNRLTRTDVARINDLGQLSENDEEKNLRVEFSEDGRLVPSLTPRKEKAPSERSKKNAEEAMDVSPKGDPDESDGEMDGDEAEEVVTRDSDKGKTNGGTKGRWAVAPRRSSVRIAAANIEKQVESADMADEELLVVSDWMPERTTRAAAQQQVAAGERWLEVLGYLLTMDRLRRKVQARALKQLNSGSSAASSGGKTTSFERNCIIQMATLQRSLDLLRDCLGCKAGNDGKQALSQSLLQESLDVQRELKVTSPDLYAQHERDMINDRGSDSSAQLKRPRQYYRNTAQAAKLKFPKSSGPMQSGELSEDDEEFQPAEDESDVETSEDEDGIGFEGQTFSASPPPPPRKKRGSIK